MHVAGQVVYERQESRRGPCLMQWRREKGWEVRSDLQQPLPPVVLLPVAICCEPMTGAHEFGLPLSDLVNDDRVQETSVDERNQSCDGSWL